jgi:hypothetical protein
LAVTAGELCQQAAADLIQGAAALRPTHRGRNLAARDPVQAAQNSRYSSTLISG